MLEQITESWWKLTYADLERKYVFFGRTEGEVTGKFNAWINTYVRSW